MKILATLITHRKTVIKAILSAAVAFLLSCGITLYKQNKKLSERLEMAQNNIEAYQGSLQESQQACNVLQLTVDELHNYNDELVHKLDSFSKKNKIKPRSIKTAATQSQHLNVSDSKGVRGDILEVIKDSVYNDTIKYNDLTSVYYTIQKDSVSIELDIKNTQYLFVYTNKRYKNNKTWLKRLLTLDWKKVTRTKYVIENTNSLIKTDSVRVVEIKNL